MVRRQRDNYSHRFNEGRCAYIDWYQNVDGENASSVLEKHASIKYQVQRDISIFQRR